MCTTDSTHNDYPTDKGTSITKLSACLSNAESCER
jgi:hypothetical protein